LINFAYDILGRRIMQSVDADGDGDTTDDGEIFEKYQPDGDM